MKSDEVYKRFNSSSKKDTDRNVKEGSAASPKNGSGADLLPHNLPQGEVKERIKKAARPSSGEK